MFDKLKKVFGGEKVPANAATVTFGIEGMTCNHCAMNIRNRFDGVEGVFRAEVSFPEGKGTFVYDPERVTPEQIVAIIEDGGSYKVRR